MCVCVCVDHEGVRERESERGGSGMQQGIEIRSQIKPEGKSPSLRLTSKSSF